MTACFLFSAAGTESSRFNYFRNFADPGTAPCAEKMGRRQSSTTAMAASVDLKCRNLSSAGFYMILLTFHLFSKFWFDPLRPR